MTRTLTVDLDLLRAAGRLRLEAQGCAVLLALVDGEVHAVEDACRHRGTALSGGLLRDGIVTCPAHLWQYDVRTGHRHDTHGEPLPTYPVALVDGTVEVTIPDPVREPTLREILLAHAHAPTDTSGDRPLGTIKEVELHDSVHNSRSLRRRHVTDIDVVLWDIGQVLYQSPFERFDELEAYAGIPSGTLPRGPFAAVRDAAYDQVDVGERDEPDYWRDIEEVAQRSVPGLHIYDALRELGWKGRGRPVVLTLLADVTTRYRQAVLTNDATKFLGDGWRESWEYAGYFERIIDSLDIGVRKPDVRAFAASVELLGRPPLAGSLRGRPDGQRRGRPSRRPAGIPVRDDGSERHRWRGCGPGSTSDRGRSSRTRRGTPPA